MSVPIKLRFWTKCHANPRIVDQVQNNLPFKFWNTETWKFLGSALEAAYNMTINQEVMGRQVSGAFERMMEEIQINVRDRLVSSIKFDLGKRHTRNILGINIPFCDNQLKTVVKTLAMVEHLTL